MNKLVKPGRIIFALGMMALAVLCIISKDFILGRPPVWPVCLDLNPALAYISAALLIIAALAILNNTKGSIAALLIAGLIFVLSVCRYLQDPLANWIGGCKALALFGGALIVAGSYFTNEHIRKTIFVVTGCVTVALFFIAGGYGHFKYAGFVKDFIPAYIPFRGFWTYFCGICLIAGGIGILIPRTRRLAAFLSGIMIGGWFVLLHIPRFLMNTSDASDRMGLFESFTFVGICFVLAGISDQEDRAEGTSSKL